MTMLERAMEAVKAALLNDAETDAYMRAEDESDYFLIDGHIRLTPVVRAVLQAIREPSERMKGAGRDELIYAKEVDYNDDGACGEYTPPSAADGGIIPFGQVSLDSQEGAVI